MYSIAENEKNHTILSLKELIAIIIVFAFMLYILFPKGDIEDLLQSEHENTNLSINYLESMLLYHPDNLELKILLIKNYRYKGELDKATVLNNELLQSTTDHTTLQQLYEQEYLILKERYFQLAKKEQQQKELMPLLHQKLRAYYDYLGDQRDYLFFFAEATQINHQALKYLALNNLMKQRPELVDYEFQKKAYYLASSLNYTEEAYAHLSKLLEYPSIDRQLQEGALSLLINHGEYKRAFKIAKQLFVRSQDQEEVMHLFNITLYALQQIPDDGDIQSKIKALVQLYKESKTLKHDDIYLLLHTLLQTGNTTASSLLAQELFETQWEDFDEEVCQLAIQSLQYSNDLETALQIAYFAYGRYMGRKWLDATIRLSMWTSKVNDAITLSKYGYTFYGDQRYEQSILDTATFHSEYALLGQIYQNKVADGNLSAIAYVAEYFDYTGEIDQGENYFTQLLRYAPCPEAHKQAIIFSYNNANLDKALSLYISYQKKYGDDTQLLQLMRNSAIAKKRYPQAYTYAKAFNAMQAQLSLDKYLTDLAWLQKDYRFMHQQLWNYEKENLIDPSYYYRLVQLEEALSPKPRTTYLYRKAWDSTHNPSYLMALLYGYMDNKNYTAFESVIEDIPESMQHELEKSNHYLILMANFYSQQTKLSKALKYFDKALLTSPKDTSLHQAYLWFLIDRQLSQRLNHELTLLRQAPVLRQQVGFPSVVAAMSLQKSDLALRWLLPLLHEEKERFEYQLLYADLLELQDRHEGAKKARHALFARMEQMIATSPELLNDKHFARAYLNMVVRYVYPYAKKALYFEAFQSLFSDQEFNELKLGWYTYTQSDAKVAYFAHKHNINLPWLNLYLAMSRDNTPLKQKLLDESTPVLAFRDRVIASRDVGNPKEALNLAFQGLEDNNQDTDLFKIYRELLHEEHTQQSLQSHVKQLTPTVHRWKTEASLRWHLYKGIQSEVSLKEQRYLIDNRPDVTEQSLALTLQNKQEPLRWSWSIEKHFGEHAILSTQAETQYQLDRLSLGLEGIYRQRTELTPQLQLDTFEEKLKLSTQFALTHRDQIGIAYEHVGYYRNNQTYLGESQQLQLTQSHIFKAGYPDLQWSNYLNLNRYDFIPKSALAFKDFNEWGTQLSWGASSQYQFNRSWRPYGTMALSVNDQHNLGTSLSLGLTGMLNRQDQFNLMLDYSKGIGLIDDASYGVHLEYRF
ncbi:MAG TPA: tetratricopeptide repeat protein [Campylobacterales bacterium]|nr:tetratricopeptide repeat protein [Campylobacterales bacterium]